MAPTHRDFDAAPRSSPAASGTFNLGGVTWKIRSRAEVPYGLITQLVGVDDLIDNPDELAKLAPDEQRSRARAVLVQTDEFFASTIVEEQVDDFLAMVHDPHGPFTVERSEEVAQYIAQCLFTDSAEAGPTTPSRPSRPGRVPTGSTSKGGSSSPATPRSRLAV